MFATELPEAPYAVITPYLLPPGPKRVNVGDGFILDSATRLIGARPSVVLSSRCALTAADIDAINSTELVIVVGANTLKDEFEITPGFDLNTLERIDVPIVLMGVGHYGTAEHTRGLSVESVVLLRTMLERFPLMSVRCDASWQYVARSVPEYAAAIAMTSCPVIHGVDGIDRSFSTDSKCGLAVVTVTDRGDWRSQLDLLREAADHIVAERRVLALHQDYGRRELWEFAQGLGFEVFRSDDCRDFLALYRSADLHFGNRVHAHLKCLSLGVRSFCAPFDLRQFYFAESLGFPLVTTPSESACSAYDFAAIAARRDGLRIVMDRFVATLRQRIGL